MPIYFRSIPVREPFTFDSFGNRWDQERVLRPGGYPLYHYLQTEKGRGRIEIQGETHTLESGEGVLIAPFVSHSYERETDEWLTLFATLTGTMESGIGTMLGNRQVVFVKKDLGLRIAQWMEGLVGEYGRSAFGGKQLSVACYEFLMNFADGVYGDELSENPLYRQYVAPVIKEIETRYYEKLTVASLCGSVYVTQQYLTRLFRRFVGCSVYEYLTSYRISKAKELLLQNRQAEIQSIGHLVGFEDASHFIFMFRKMTGMTPTGFRSLYKNRRDG